MALHPAQKPITTVKPMFSEARLSGVFTALVTPFSADGSSVDTAALDTLVEAQIAGGVSGLVPVGTTGESPTLTEAEQRLVIQRTVQVAKGRVPVIAGAGSFATQKTIHGCQAALEAGADAVMIVMPYYNRPTQAGLVEHVLHVAAAVKGPVVLYNIPVRTGIDLSVDATEAICAKAPNVIGMKDATGNVLRCQELVRRLGDRLTIMSGDDSLTLGMMACGARGLISTTSNLLPKQVSEVCRLASAGDWKEARRAHLALLPVYETMFLEANPGPLKFALSQASRMSPAVRLPLVTPGEAVRDKISEAVRRYLGAA
jgi:4-hydroxy-tetrahydrodipicolinate synthase